MSTSRTARPEDFVPTTEAVYAILLVLAGGRSHGYAIMLEVERLTDGAVALGPGTLYRSIERMLDDRLIAEVGGPAAGRDERRRVYELTALGSEVAHLESARLEKLVGLARRRGLLGPAAAAKGARTAARRGASS